MSNPKEIARKFKGVWIPKAVWLHPGLTWLEKCVVAEIDSLSDEKEPCTAGDEYLAEMFQVARGRLANILTALRKKGVIETVSFNGRRRGLKVKAAFTETVKADPTDIDRGAFTETVKAEAVAVKTDTNSCSSLESPAIDADALKAEKRKGSRKKENDKPGNPEHNKFRDLWHNNYPAYNGRPWDPHGSEFQHLGQILNRTQFTAEQLYDVVKAAWLSRAGPGDHYWAQKLTSIRVLNLRFNEICDELVKCGKLPGATAEPAPADGGWSVENFHKKFNK